ncbi:uncharacterized protein [Salmo salar]|uniref:Ig-like domain-containing protein n=1 Tax=Salmo salar TaxID=8030 RepID=A0A1S3PA22_SALSA|nr:uncharacterized protein LOC106584108 [Salmo salar]
MQTRKGLFVMAVSQWMFCAAVLLLLIQGLQCSPVPPACPEPCLCQKDLLNCSFAGLSQAQQHVPSTVTELDLSHNLLKSITPSWPSWGLKNLWLGHNSITHLSLCVRRTWRGKHWKIPLSHSRGRCVSWAPTLQLLSAERNQLEMIPEGLGGSEFLQVLQLSHNRISDLRPGDLSRCPLLRELHLQHNRISSLHPQALRDLPELRVLDLSFNLLTTITPSAYLLRNLNALVEVSGNRWRCDCSLRSLRRKMAYDRDRALQQTWRGVVCTSPSTQAGRDLLHLEDRDLTCSTAENRAGLHQDVTVDKGTEILLPCGSPKQDSIWWTPNGQVPGSQAGLLISDITERDAGLYVCVSGPDEESVSVFNLRVHKTQRKTRDTRSLLRERLQINPELGSIQGEGQETDLNSLDLHRATQRTQSDLVLAVCLSVFITFLVAFVIGALTRPLLDALWRRCCSCCNRTKQSASPPQSVSSAGQAPYDNMAYSDEDEREELGTPRERRVTFSGHPSELRDQNSIPYYDTLANGMQDNLAGEYDATYENVQERDTSHPSLEVYHPPEEEKPRARDSASSGSLRHDNPETDTHSGDLSDMSLSESQRGAYSGHTHDMEFESIPDPEQLQGCRSSSVSSHSGQESPDRGKDMNWPKDNLTQRLEERKTQNNSWEHRTTQKEDDSFEQSSDFPTVKPVDVPQINIGRVGEIPGFAYLNPMDPELWNDSGESFEFPDSIQSASARSSSQDLSGSAFADQLRKEYEQARNKETLVKDRRENDKSSSSNSSDSGNEPTEYTVNPEAEVVKEKEIFQDALLTHDSTTDLAAANPYLKHDVSLDKQHYKDPVSPSPDEEGFHVSEPRQGVQRSHVFSEHSDLSSDSSDEPTKYTVNRDSDEEEEDEAQVPAVTHKGPYLSLGDINVSLAPRKALNIGFSEDGFQYQPEPETRLTGLDLTTQSAISTKEPLPQPSLPSDVARVEDPPVSVYIPRVRKRLDIQPPQEASPAPAKTPPPSESSSSSESEDETTDNSVKLDREVPDVSQKNSSLSLGDINVSLAPRKALNIGFSKQGFQYQPEPEKRLTGLGLSFQSAITPKEPSLPSDGTRAGESPAPFYIPSLGRRLDIQPPQDTPLAPPRTPPPSGSSSSRSESEDETTMNQKREVKSQVPDSSFIPAGIDVSFAPRKALNIGFSKEGFQYQSELETRSTSLDLSSQRDITPKEPLPQHRFPEGTTTRETPLDIPSLRRRLDIQATQETPPAAPGSRPHAGSSSSNSESEDETTMNQKREEKSQVPDSSFIPEGIDVSFAPRKALNIGFSKEGFQYQSEPSLTGMGLTSQITISTKEPFPKSSIPSDGTRDEESLVPLYIPSFKRHVDIQPPQETPPAAPQTPPPSGSTSSGSESKELDRKVPDVTHNDPFLSLGDINVSIAPRKALNISFSKEGFQYQQELETRSPSLDLSSQSDITPKEPLPQNRFPEGTTTRETPLDIPSLRRRLDIQATQETPPAAPGSRPHAGSSSSNSESEDETTMNQKREEKSQVPDSSFIPEGIDVSFAPRKALNIGFSKEGFQYQSEPSLTGMGLTSQITISTKEPFPKSSIPSDGTRDEESLVPLYIPSFKRHVDIQPPQETPPAFPQTPQPSGSSSSGSESKELDREVPDVTHKDPFLSLGDINVSIAPRKALNISFSKEGFQYQQELETRSPSLDLSSQSDITPKEPLPQNRFPEGTTTRETPLDIPSLRRRLDIQATQETPPAAPGSRPHAGSSSSNSESEDETTMNQKREEKSQVPDSSFIPEGIDVSFAPRKALNIGFSKEGFQYQSEPSLTGMGLTSQITISTKEHFPKSLIPSDGTRDEESLVPLYIPRFRRHVDIQPHQETPPASLRTSHNSESPSSSSESEDETTMNQKRKEEKAKVPDVTYKYPSLSPRDTPINVSFVPRKALNIGFSKESFQNQSSESKYESITTTNDRGFQEDAKPAPKASIFSSTSSERARTEEPPVPLYIPGLRRHQNIQPSQDATLAESSSASSENGDELTEHTKKPGRDVTDFSLSPGDTPINVSFAPRRALNISLYNSASTTDEVERKTGAEDRWERPGLGGLKALSETQRWDTKDSSTNMNVCLSQRSALNINSDSSTDEVDRRARADYSSPILERSISRKDGGFKEETNPYPQLSLPKTSLFFSTSTDEARPIESPLQIPHHRRRLVVDIQPHLAPPAAPGTPPPFPEGEEAAGSGWRSRGQQRRRAMDGFGRTSMTQGDEGENYMGLLAAKPFGTARQYQSVTPDTIMATQHSEISERDGSDLTFSTVRHSEA